MNEQMQEELTCPICLELLKKPIVALPCQHNLCRSCAADVFKEGQTNRCPTCRLRLLSDITVSHLPRNRTLENLIDIHIKSKGDLPPVLMSESANEAYQLPELFEMAASYQRESEYEKARNILKRLDEQVVGVTKCQVKTDIAKCLVGLEETEHVPQILQQMVNVAVKHKEEFVEDDWNKILKDCRDMAVKLGEREDIIAAINVMHLLVQLCKENSDPRRCIEQLVVCAATMQELVAFVKNSRKKDDFDSFGFSLLQEISGAVETVTNIESHFKCRQLSRCLKCTGFCYNRLFHYQESIKVHQRAIHLMELEFKKDAVLYRLYGLCHNNLGVAYSKLKMLGNAKTAFQTAIDAYQQVLDWDNETDKMERINLCIKALADIT